ncbi:MAG: hypothetical protein FWC40_05910 [Proteobacteria bacterium]|nr:hypothetical protein [Pseudomonadota bacterium]
MAKLSPCAEVKEKFGSKEALAKIVLKQAERPEGLSEAEFERKILTVSNRKLLKLYAAHEEMTKRFGSKAALADAISTLKLEKSTDKIDTVYRAKLLTLRVAQLLDIHKGLAKKQK